MGKWLSRWKIDSCDMSTAVLSYNYMNGVVGFRVEDVGFVV